MLLIFKKALEPVSFQKAFVKFDVTFLLVFSRFHAVSTVLVRKIIFLIFSVRHIYIFIIFKYLFKNVFVTTDENDAYQASVDIGTYRFYYLSIIHFYSMRVNGNKSCRKKHL